MYSFNNRFIDRLTAGIACGAVCNLSLHFNDSDVFSRYLYLFICAACAVSSPLDFTIMLALLSLR